MSSIFVKIFSLDILYLVGFLFSILIGVALGLIGGGGSILTVPVLVYLLGVEPIAATAYSLFIVGLSSAVGSIRYFRDNLVNLQAAIVFGLPSIAAVFITRAYLVPAIPLEVFSISGFMVTKSMLLMLIFAVLMIVASYTMIKKIDEPKANPSLQKLNYPLMVCEGALVGLLTGLVGAGGGFLIIPALVVLAKLPMKKAVGTSLAIIAAKSLIGFVGEGEKASIDWMLLCSVCAFAIFGIYLGSVLSKKLDESKLKPAFGWFILVMGFCIILKETIGK